jgi:hypothetical protein
MGLKNRLNKSVFRKYIRIDYSRFIRNLLFLLFLVETEFPSFVVGTKK